MSFLDLYAPKTLSKICGQEHVTVPIINMVEKNRFHRAIMLSGMYGTGKTTIARILARSLNCLNSDKPTLAPCGKCEVCRDRSFDITEINIPDDSSTESMRRLVERSQFFPLRARYGFLLLMRFKQLVELFSRFYSPRHRTSLRKLFGYLPRARRIA